MKKETLADRARRATTQGEKRRATREREQARLEAEAREEEQRRAAAEAKTMMTRVEKAVAKAGRAGLSEAPVQLVEWWIGRDRLGYVVKVSVELEKLVRAEGCQARFEEGKMEPVGSDPLFDHTMYWPSLIVRW